MEKITESLEMLYGSSGTPFFLSDEFGNIKWKNTACGETIVFPKGINCDILTEQSHCSFENCEIRIAGRSVGVKCSQTCGAPQAVLLHGKIRFGGF